MKNKELVLDVVLDESAPLPEELIVSEIFTRLPVKSLYRLRCVSKFCRSLTSHPPFLDALRRRSGDRYILSFLSAGCEWGSVMYYSNPELQCPIIDSDTNETYYSYIRSINGLICLVEETKVVILKAGMKAKFLLPLHWRGTQEDKHYFYFCYDPETDRYKVLRTTCFRMNVDLDFIVYEMRLSIFTLGVDISWRDLHLPPGLYQLGKSKSVCINGVLFCNNFSTSNDIGDGVIAAYAVRDEYFLIIPYPEGLFPSRYGSCHLVNVKGSIAVVDVQDIRSCGIRMWIKSEGFSYQSWMERRIGIPPPLENIFILSYNFSFSNNSNGEIVIGLAGMSSPRCWVFCHNIDTGKWRRIHIAGLQPHVIYGDFLVEEYVETLLLLREALKIRYKTPQLHLN